MKRMQLKKKDIKTNLIKCLWS